MHRSLWFLVYWPSLYKMFISSNLSISNEHYLKIRLSWEIIFSASVQRKASMFHGKYYFEFADICQFYKFAFLISFISFCRHLCRGLLNCMTSTCSMSAHALWTILFSKRFVCLYSFTRSLYFLFFKHIFHRCAIYKIIFFILLTFCRHWKKHLRYFATKE